MQRKPALFQGLWLFFLLFLFSFPVEAAFEALIPAGSPPPEFRGLWVARWSLTSPEAIHDMVALAKEGHLNALLVQVDGQGEALYHSQLLPWAEVVNADFDPLAVLLKEAHDAGLEVHAWINVFPVGSFEKWPAAAQHVLNQHKDWITVDARGKSILNYTPAERKNLTTYFLEPGLPEVQEFATAVVLEIVKNYPVDGIHLDYIRYPGRQFGYHPRNREAFAREYGLDPVDLFKRTAELQMKMGAERFAALQEAWDQWRRDQVTETVRRIRLGIMAIRPEVKLSAAVISDQQAAENLYFQAWPKWLAEGLVDFVAPMAYDTSTAKVVSEIKKAVEVAGERHVYAGLGAWRMLSQPAQIAEKIEEARRAGAQGVVLFDYRSLTGKREVMSYLREKVFPQEVEPPLLAWKEVALDPDQIPRPEKLLLQMNLAAKVAQMFLVRLTENRLTDELKDFLSRTPPAGIILAPNGEDLPKAVALADEAQLLSLQGKNLIPLWVGWDDREGWPPFSGFTPFPTNLALAATRDPGTVEAVARAKAEELRGAGINLLLFRMTLEGGLLRGEDLLRSFGEDRTQAKILTQAFLFGLRRRGMVVLPQPFREGEEVEILRFDELPYRPRVVDLTGLSLAQMRSRMVTEIGAGADLFIIGDEPGVIEAAFNGLMEVFQGNGQALQRLNFSVEKVLRLKTEAGLWSRRLHAAIFRETVGTAEHQELARSTARGAVTLVRDEAGLLPAVAAGRYSKIVVIESRGKGGATLSRELQELVPGLGMVIRPLLLSTEPSAEEIATAARNAQDADLAVIVTTHVRPYGGWLDVIQALQGGPSPLIVVAAGDPRDLYLFPQVGTYLVVYGDDPPSLRAGAEVILGRTSPQGLLPVAISSLYPAGYGQVTNP